MWYNINMIKRFLPTLFLIVIINLLGYCFHVQYYGTVAGSVVGGTIGFIVSEIRFRRE